MECGRSDCAVLDGYDAGRSPRRGKHVARASVAIPFIARLLGDASLSECFDSRRSRLSCPSLFWRRLPREAAGASPEGTCVDGPAGNPIGNRPESRGAQAGSSAKPPAATVARMTEEQKVIYALGLLMQRSLGQFDSQLSGVDIFKRALSDAALGKPALDVDAWRPRSSPSRPRAATVSSFARRLRRSRTWRKPPPRPARSRPTLASSIVDLSWHGRLAERRRRRARALPWHPDRHRVRQLIQTERARRVPA